MKPFWQGIRRVTVKGGVLWLTTDDYTEGRRKIRWHRLSRIDEGEPAFLEALARVKGALLGPITAGDMPLQLRAWLDVKRKELASEAARIEYERMAAVIAEAFKDFDVAQVATGDVLTFLEDWADKPTAQRAYRARLSTFFAWAVVKGMRGDNPCAPLRMKRPPKRTVTATPELYHRIRDAMLVSGDARPTRSGAPRRTQMGEIGQCFMDLAYLTGQRITDVRLLKRVQIGDRSIAFLPSKTATSSARAVEVPLTPAIREVLERLAAINRGREQPHLSPYAITTRKATPYTASGIRSLWKRALRRAGVDTRLTLKDLRPTFATDAVRQGASLQEIQTALAHTTQGTTEGYVRARVAAESTIALELPRRPES